MINKKEVITFSIFSDSVTKVKKRTVITLTINRTYESKRQNTDIKYRIII